MPFPMHRLCCTVPHPKSISKEGCDDVRKKNAPIPKGKKKKKRQCWLPPTIETAWPPSSASPKMLDPYKPIPHPILTHPIPFPSNYPYTEYPSSRYPRKMIRNKRSLVVPKLINITSHDVVKRKALSFPLLKQVVGIKAVCIYHMLSMPLFLTLTQKSVWTATPKFR